MNIVNRICPKCNNPNYVVSLGNFSNAFQFKCMNCNSYLCEEDFWPAQKDDNNGWISVKDRLPENSNEVLTYGNGLIRVMCLLDHGSGDGDYLVWEDDYGYYEELDNVTHWMPLPEPPKEG